MFVIRTSPIRLHTDVMICAKKDSSILQLYKNVRYVRILSLTASLAFLNISVKSVKKAISFTMGFALALVLKNTNQCYLWLQEQIIVNGCARVVQAIVKNVKIKCVRLAQLDMFTLKESVWHNVGWTILSTIKNFSA